MGLNEERMTRKKEADLVSSVEQVINLVNSGLTPTDALHKVASDALLNQEYIRRVGEAYNQSRTLYELGNRDGKDRLGIWATADINKVAAAMLPKSDDMVFRSHMSKAASAGDYISAWGARRNINRLPGMAKAAEACGPGETCGNIPTPKKEEKEVKTKPVDIKTKDARFNQLADSEEKFSSLLDDVVYRLRTGYLRGVKFHEVEKAATAKWGANATPIMDALFGMSHAKSAGQRRALSSELDPSSVTLTDIIAPTFASVERLVGAAVDMHKRAGILGRKALQNRLPTEKKADGEASKGSGSTGSWKLPNPVETTGGTFRLASRTGEIFDKVLGDESTVKDDARKYYKEELGKNVLKLEDPAFRNEMQAIDAKYTLGDLMANDPIISGYSPDEVLDAFNDVSEVAPGAAGSTAIMRDLLRRHLTQGGLQAMDVNQAMTVNKGMTSDTSTRERLSNMTFDPSKDKIGVKDKDGIKDV